MATYTTPGAYIEWKDASSDVVSPLRTDVAGFIGLAERGPIDTPVAVESPRQFEALFGGFTGAGFLAYAVRGFFENGGKRCWVVRVAAANGARAAAPSSFDLASDSASPSASTSAGVPRWTLAASSAGTWGNGLSVAMTAVTPASTFTLRGATSARWVDVDSVAKLQRADLVRISQPGLASPLYRVVSYVDPIARRIYFVHPDARQGLAYDAPLVGLLADVPLQIDSVAYSIAVRLNGRPAAFIPVVTLVPEHPRYGPIVLAQPIYPLVRVAGRPLPAVPPPIVVVEHANDPRDVPVPLAIVQGTWLALASGHDGLADLTVDDFVGSPVATGASEAARKIALRGMRALDLVDEVAIVAAPDLVVQPETEPSYAAPDPPSFDPCLSCPPRPVPSVFHQPPLSAEVPPQFSDDEVFLMQSTLVELCEARSDRIALLDPTALMVQDAARGFPMLQEWRARFDTRHAALYYPWLHVVDPLAVEPTRQVPACGHIAGLYAQIDLAIGVHRAPANRVLAWAEDVTAVVDDARHGELNTLGVNVLRALPGLGLRVLGARTLSTDPRWRFVNVRRLVMMIMKAIDHSTQWAVFEPNDSGTRARLAQVLREFLGSLWARGALVGGTPGEAFAVQCDDHNNPEDTRADGRLIADVAIAPSRPFEFVVLRIGRQGNGFEIQEQSTTGGSA